MQQSLRQCGGIPRLIEWVGRQFPTQVLVVRAQPPVQGEDGGRQPGNAFSGVQGGGREVTVTTALGGPVEEVDVAIEAVAGPPVRFLLCGSSLAVDQVCDGAVQPVEEY